MKTFRGQKFWKSMTGSKTIAKIAKRWWYVMNTPWTLHMLNSSQSRYAWMKGGVFCAAGLYLNNITAQCHGSYEHQVPGTRTQGNGKCRNDPEEVSEEEPELVGKLKVDGVQFLAEAVEERGALRVVSKKEEGQRRMCERRWAWMEREAR